MKYIKYIKYIIIHKWFVFLACCKYGSIWQGITHDLSKLLPSEFIPYARYFYGKYGKSAQEKINQKFDIAWLKHIHRNKHHWQYWVLRKDDGDTIPLKIPRKYQLEMICDWIGAGRAINGKSKYNDPLEEARRWYLVNSCKQLLHRENQYCISDFFSD